MLAFDRITSLPLTDSIETFARDLDIQGPNFPSDSVCLFLEWCLAISASDSRLFRLHFPDKVLSWLTNAWRPLDGVSRSHSFGQPRPHADPLSTSGLLLLIRRLAGYSLPIAINESYFVPDCPVGTQALDLSETARVRDFIEARVPPTNGNDAKSTFKTPSSFDTTGGGTEDIEQTKHRRVSAWLAKTLEGFVQEGQAMGETSWSNMSLDLARRHLDLASIALGVEGLFSLAIPDRPETPAIRLAGTVITRLAPTLALKKWQPAERAYLLSGLDLILAPIDASNEIDYPVFLNAGTASGIPDAFIPPSDISSQNTVDLDSPEFRLLRAIWKSPCTRETLEELLSALRFILGAVTQTDSSPLSTGAFSQAPSTQASQRLKELEETQKNDDFGDIKITARAAQSHGPTTAHRAAQAYMLTCIRGFVSAEMALSGSNGAIRLVEVVEAIISAEGADGIVVAEQAFKAVKSGLASFGLAQCDSILTYFGNDLLPNYHYARDERFHLVALRFLECVATTWVRAEGPTEEFGTLARQLCAFYLNGLRKGVLASWRIRLQVHPDLFCLEFVIVLISPLRLSAPR